MTGARTVRLRAQRAPQGAELKMKDVFTSHLVEMKAMNAGYKRLELGAGRCRRLDLVFKTLRGQVVMQNRLTGTTARGGDPAARAALAAEVGPWLEFIRLRIAWQLAPAGSPARTEAAAALVGQMDQMVRLGLLSEAEAAPEASP